MFRFLLAGLTIFTFAGLAEARDLLGQSDIDKCIEVRDTAGENVTDCVDIAQSQCNTFGTKAPLAALQCFRGVKEEWDEYIRTRMEQVNQTANEKLFALVQIEVKYDLLQNLLQCDRMTELQLLQSPSPEESALQQARCEATATGLVYVKFYWQSRNIE
ncbi:MAG: hypothetical protein OEZ19_04945 [Paracoccaceae bacterium]|nr:hypothetical protein [Paracoccaceae bacterium]